MSIYAQLLSDALSQSPSDDSSTTGEAIAQLVKARDRLSVNRSSYTEPDWASAAVADQLAYDVALIELARLLGIEVGVARFSRPLPERTRLERALVSRGIPLDQIDEPTEAEPQLKWGHR